MREGIVSTKPVRAECLALALLLVPVSGMQGQSHARAYADTCIYRGVVFSKGGKVYPYIADDPTIRPGDRVVVPAGFYDGPKVVAVVGGSRHTRQNEPCPVSRTKRVLRRLNEPAIRGPSSPKGCGDDGNLFPRRRLALRKVRAEKPGAGTDLHRTGPPLRHPPRRRPLRTGRLFGKACPGRASLEKQVEDVCRIRSRPTCPDAFCKPLRVVAEGGGGARRTAGRGRTSCMLSISAAKPAVFLQGRGLLPS